MSERILFELADFLPTKQKGTWLDGHIGHLSASSLGMFRRCPRQWQQRYLKGRKEPPGEALVIGNFFHETLNWNYGQKIVSHEDRPLSEVIEFLQDAAVPRVVDAAGGVGEIRWDTSDPDKGLDAARSDSQRITTAYHSQILPRMQPVATEQRLEWHIDGMPVPLIGFLDTITAHSVVDTKTGKQAVSKLKPSWQLQADIYSSWCGLPIEYHTINRAASPKIVTPLESEALLVQTTQAEARNLLNVMIEMTKQIEWMYETYGDGEWPANGRYADWTQNISPCGYCGYKKDCPAFA